MQYKFNIIIPLLIHLTYDISFGKYNLEKKLLKVYILRDKQFKDDGDFLSR